MDHISKQGGQSHNSRVLKKQLHVSQIYRVPIDRLQSTPSWLTFETHGNHKVSIHYF